MIGRKSVTNVTVKDAEQGLVEAVFSTFDVIDKDGDVTRKGAFTNGARVVMSAYGHKSWDGELPIGVGTIEEVGNTAVFKGRFFLDTQHGLDAFRTVKALSEHDLQEWSYSLHDVETERGTVDGKAVRILKKITVKEVSPVLIGAGVNTRTVGVKGRRKQMESTISDLLETAAAERWPNGYVWLEDYDVDNGLAVFCVYTYGVGERLLQVSFTRSDTSATLGDTELEVIEIDTYVPKAGPNAGIKFSEHCTSVVAAVKTLTTRAADVVALRAEKSKTISEESAGLLSELDSALMALKALIEAPPTTTPDDARLALDAEFLRFVAISQGVAR
jgi:hypothetical protein